MKVLQALSVNNPQEGSAFDDMTMKYASVFIALLSCKFVASRNGFVSNFYIDTKFYCPSASKHVFFVKSEIQCIHRCLQQDSCELINYNAGSKENCEVFTEKAKCAANVGIAGWKAVSIQVCTTDFESND